MPDLESEDPEEKLVDIMEHVKGLLETGASGRFTYIEALAYISMFFDALNSKAGVRLMILSAALSDLDRGVVPKLLRPAHIDNRPGDSSAEWTKRAYAALALECLMRTGKRSEPAASELALLSKIPAQDFITWRHEFKADRVKNVLGPLTWRESLKRLDLGAYGSDMRDAARAFLRNLEIWNEFMF
jgi:hypothetical protein